MKTGSHLLLVLMFFSCQSAPQRRVMPEERLQSIYIALLNEGDRQRMQFADTSRSFKSDSIFHAFDTSEEEFRSAIAEYRGEPEKWQKFFEGVVKKLDERQGVEVKKRGN